MTLSNYRSMGGLEGFIDKRTRRLVNNMKMCGYGEQQLYEMFSLVVDIDENGCPVSKVAARTKIEELFSSEIVEDELEKHFYLRAEADERDGGSALTLAHEVYFDEWPLLRTYKLGRKE